jgi:hypothetical protein
LNIHFYLRRHVDSDTWKCLGLVSSGGWGLNREQIWLSIGSKKNRDIPQVIKLRMPTEKHVERLSMIDHSHAHPCDHFITVGLEDHRLALFD